VYVIVGFGLIPLIMRQPVTSAYELLEKRLGMGIRKAGASVFLLLRVGWMATILYATSAVILVPLLQVDPSWAPVFCVVIGMLTAIYSSSGGFRAVVTTDAIQAITMVVGAIVTLAVISYRLGGVGGWWPSSWPTHWQQPSWGFDPSVRVSFGVLLLSTTLWYVCTNGSDQMSIQRFLSTRDAKAARRTLLVAQIADATMALLLALTGVAILGFYQATSTVDLAAVQAQGDKYFPTFIMNEMPAGLAGLVVAAILAAALSSLASGLNSCCAVLERDFLADAGDMSHAPELAARHSVQRMKRLTWLFAVSAIVLGIMNTMISGNLLERCFKLVNLLTAPLFILFFLALFVPWANALGAWLGLLSSIATAVLIAYAPDFGIDIGISFVWMMPCALLVGVVVGVAGSAIGQGWQANSDGGLGETL
jgi:SSS family solute:Na+ symporter